MVKFILNIDNEHVEDFLYPRATFGFRSSGEKLPRQGGLPGVVQQVTCMPLEVDQGNKNSCEQLQASDRALRQS